MISFRCVHAVVTLYIVSMAYTVATLHIVSMSYTRVEIYGLFCDLCLCGTAAYSSEGLESLRDGVGLKVLQFLGVSTGTIAGDLHGC